MFHQGHPLWTPSFSLLGCLTSRPSYWLRFFFFFCRSTSERYFIGDTLAITVSQKTSRLACAIHCVVVDQLSRIAFPSESNLLSLVCVVSPAAAALSLLSSSSFHVAFRLDRLLFPFFSYLFISYISYTVIITGGGDKKARQINSPGRISGPVCRYTVHIVRKEREPSICCCAGWKLAHRKTGPRWIQRARCKDIKRRK